MNQKETNCKSQGSGVRADSRYVEGNCSFGSVFFSITHRKSFDAFCGVAFDVDNSFSDFSASVG